MVVLGYFSYVIQEHKASEVDLAGKFEGSAVFELRQFYFSIFFIPFFPLSKLWYIKLPGKESECLSPEMQVYLDKFKKKRRRPWHLFIGVYLLLIAGVYFLNYYLEENKRLEEYRKEALKKQELKLKEKIAREKRMIEKMKTPQKGDCYKFNIHPPGEKEKIVVYQIDSVIGSRLRLTTIPLERKYLDYYSYIKNFFDDLKNPEIPKYSYWTSADSLRNCYTPKGKLYNNHSGMPLFKALGETVFYTLSVYREGSPGEESNWDCYTYEMILE